MKAPGNSVSASNLRGIALLVVALSIAAFVGAVMKALGEQVSAVQVAWIRFSGMTLMLAPFLLWRYGRAALRPVRPAIQLLRGLAMAGGTTAFVFGVRTVDYADAIAILYAYPFLLVILAVLFLGECASWPVWLGVACGFAGVLLVMRPSFDSFDSGTLFIFLSAAIVSIQLALNRKLGNLGPPLVTALAGAFCAAVALTLLLPGAWAPIPAGAWPYVGLLVLCGTANNVLLIYAFVHADASTLAPFTYFEIVSAVVFGYLFFGSMPSLLSWCGILLITLGGLYVAHRLHRQNIARQAAVPMEL